MKLIIYCTCPDIGLIGYLEIFSGLYIVLFPVLGPEFQTRIRQNEQNNPKFNFLNTGDPYHAYYQHKVKEFKENDGKSK